MMRAEPLSQYRLTEHARVEMLRRRISETHVAEVLASPEQVEEVREGRLVYQSRVEMGEPAQAYLFRVFVDIDRHPPEVVTVYRTTKIGKYWRDRP